MVEKDPTGRDPKQGGAKLDAGKNPIFQGVLSYFPRALEAVSIVSFEGAKKYSWKGWESVPDGVNRYSDALGRHLLEEGKGNLYDNAAGGTNLLHAAQICWNALARLELMLKSGISVITLEK